MVMQQVILNCATGEEEVCALSAAQTADLVRQQQQAQQEEQARAAELAFRQLQARALAAVAGLLHGPQAAPDAAALAALVHRLVADPPQPLSAPEVCTLLRFILRCLLP